MEQRRSIVFYLNGKRVQLVPDSPTQTVLQFLRDTQGLTGTKEGCAEGDCGACTVTQADLDTAGRIRYRPINACIRFLPTLDGKVVWTVEGLSANGQQHPVQQAMVEHHASQCGFCTPGFVMSLFAMYAQGVRQPSRDQVVDQLSGNLCRCTGYRPIIDAGRQIKAHTSAAPDHAQVQAWLYALQEDCSTPVRFTGSDPVSAQSQSWYAPRTAGQLAEYLTAWPDSTVLAGGTDVGLWVTRQQRQLDNIVYLGDVADLQTMQQDQAVRIGAGVLLEDAWPVLVEAYPELQELWKRFASVPIRSSGTLVGNLANGSPIGDAAPALIVLGAQVVIRNGAQVRRLPLEKLYVSYGKQARQPGEWIEALEVPVRPDNSYVASYKLSKRIDQDISAVCSAYALELDPHGIVRSIRIAHGGMAATTRRAIHTEAALLGEPWLEPTIRNAMQAMLQDYEPLSDMRASSRYQMTAAQNLLYRFYLQTQGSTPTRVYGEYDVSH